MSLDYYKKINGTYLATSQKEVMINDYRAEMDGQIEGNIDWEVISISDQNYNVLIVDDGSIGVDKFNQKRLISYFNDKFVVGDMFIWKNAKWFILKLDVNDKIYNTYIIQMANNELRFYSDTLTLQTILCVMGKGSINQDETRTITLASNEYLITCPDNSITSKLTANQRFVLSGKAYKVIGDVDNVTQVGLLNIKVVSDSINIEDDNLTLGIANYYSNQITREITILNGSSAELLYTNQTLQLNVQAKENGVIIENPTVTYTTSSAYVCTVSSTGLITANGTGSAIVKAKFGDSEDTISVESSMVLSDNYTIVISPTDTTMKTNRTTTFTATVMNNGIVASLRTVEWSLVNSDGSSNNYADYVSDQHSITVNTKGIYNKFIKIKAILDIDEFVTMEREIKIVSLI